MKLQRYSKNPILSPNPENPWECAVTTNPGAWYDEKEGTIYLLYRAAGFDKEHRIYLGLAKSSDGYSFERVSNSPIFGPSVDGFDAGCVEDPRIIKIDDWYYITYATRAFPPGQYWLDPTRVVAETVPNFPQSAPASIRENLTSTGLALTQDFKTFIRAGRITNPLVDDRDVILFPEKINGKYYFLHRPKDGYAEKIYGVSIPTVRIAYSDDMLHLDNSKILLTSKYDWESEGKMGANIPPIKTKDGWFVLYHAVGADKKYRLGALLLDLDDPSKVLHRSPDWLLQPEEDYELEGYYKGVVFPCGAIVKDDTLFVYYGGADKYVGLATCNFPDLLNYLKQSSI